MEDRTPLEELLAYLGSRFDETRLRDPLGRLAQDWRRADPRTPAEIREFYQTSEGYLYALAAWHETPDRVRQTDHLLKWALRRGARSVLEYGCGIGSDGLWFAEAGRSVTLVDVECPSLAFLRWRIARRGLEARCHVVALTNGETTVPGEWDFGICMDVLEHLADPPPVMDFLSEGCRLLAVNAALSGPEHPMHLPENDALVEGGLKEALEERGFQRAHHRLPWLYARPVPLPRADEKNKLRRRVPTPHSQRPSRAARTQRASTSRNDQSSPLGLVVLTGGHKQCREECLERLRAHTQASYRLVVAQGAPDRLLPQTLNQVLRHFCTETECDPILVLRDDSRVWEDGWEAEWVEAAHQWGQIFWTADPDAASGRGTASEPWWTDGFDYTCFGVSRQALARIGNLDPGFHPSLALEEWAFRGCWAFATEWGREPGLVPAMNAHLGSLYAHPDEPRTDLLRDRLRLEAQLAFR